MRLARRLLAIALFVALLVLGWRFAAANSATVTIHYLVGEAGDVSVWLALCIAFGLGAVFAGLMGLYQITRLGMLTRRYRKTVNGLEAEVHQLRNLPLVSEDPDLDESPATGGVLERGS
jgi:uncharacterized membrane protein YciS (DUF1049 family)